MDGSQHYTEEGLNYDKIRTEVLTQYKIKIIRFTNKEIKNNFIGVCEYIESVLSNTRNKEYFIFF